jgi:hypothetical protein
MKRLDVPRGAQTWELSLHTPDILASAHLVRAYVRGYQLTNDKKYLDQARRWALAGVPFVYQWSKYPTMLYATIPVFGATNWRAPNWMGLPVQWCGVAYAYSLVQLAPYDTTLDWKHLATGILITAQQMQYPTGERTGCYPDVFHLGTQQRDGPSIAPASLISLDRAIRGEPENLYVASAGSSRVLAPFRVTIEQQNAHISAVAGLKYQIVLNGTRVIDITSKGEDVVPLN